MQRYFIDISYNGTNYNGWQVQKNAISIQAIINEGFSTILNTPIQITGASRTDTGVHAIRNFAHFDVQSALHDDILSRINIFLPKDIVINKLIPVEAESHARFDAISRSYKYIILFKKDPFMIDRGYYYPYSELNINDMETTAQLLMKYENFTSFCRPNTQVKTKLCTIHSASWNHDIPNNRLTFNIKANRFLRGMIRGLVGTMIKVGNKKYNIKDFENIIQNENIDKTDFSVPPCGLYLSDIKYPYI